MLITKTHNSLDKQTNHRSHGLACYAVLDDLFFSMACRDWFLLPTGHLILLLKREFGGKGAQLSFLEWKDCVVYQTSIRMNVNICLWQHQSLSSLSLHVWVLCRLFWWLLVLARREGSFEAETAEGFFFSFCWNVKILRYVDKGGMPSKGARSVTVVWKLHGLFHLWSSPAFSTPSAEVCWVKLYAHIQGLLLSLAALLEVLDVSHINKVVVSFAINN